MATTVETLNQGDVLLVAAKGVKGGKIQLEFAEHITNPYAQSSNALVSLFNKSDKRFSSKPRRAWMSGEKTDMEGLLGIKLSDIGQGEIKELNILNPKVKGQRIRVRVYETIEPNDYQKDNVEDTAKRAGSEGDFIFHKGQHIFSNTEAIMGEPKHRFLEADVEEDEGTEEAVFEAPEELTA